VDELQVQISTSVLDLDLTQPSPSTTPFALYAKIEDAYSRPLKGLQRVLARVEDWAEVELRDDGSGAPDTFAGDGIYSGTWVPSRNGAFRPSVSVFHSLTSDSGSRTGKVNDVSVNVNGGGRLMPVDQEFTCEGGGCQGVSPSENYHRFFPSTESFSVVGAEAWEDKVREMENHGGCGT
jgi:hypothetical protein